jgi:hypothetical protein
MGSPPIAAWQCCGRMSDFEEQTRANLPPLTVDDERLLPDARLGSDFAFRYFPAND